MNGALACLGSLEHLKQKYGRGFHVEINASEERIEDVRAFVAQLFQGAEEQEYHAGRIQYLIPKQAGTTSLASIFARIEASKARLGIHDYGVSAKANKEGRREQGSDVVFGAAILSAHSPCVSVCSLSLSLQVGGASLESIFVTIAKSQDQAQAEARANHNDKREAKMK